MTVVSNTSPVSNLAIIGRLDLLREQFLTIRIPDAVRMELECLTQPGAVESIHNALAVKWLQVLPVSNRIVIRVFQERLDLGEAEAIALALECNADLLLMDESDGREIAAGVGLRVRGDLGVLRKARQSGRIPSLRDELHRLRDEAHFFVSPALERELLASVGESLGNS